MEQQHKKVQNFINLFESPRLKVMEFLILNNTKIKFKQDTHLRLVKEV